MPYSCCVAGCKSKGTMPDRHFFRFPMLDRHSANTMSRSRARQIAWLKAVNRPDFEERHFKYAKVCNLHFVSGRSAGLHDLTNADWVPTLNLSHSTEFTEIDSVQMEEIDIVKMEWNSDSTSDDNLSKNGGNNFEPNQCDTQTYDTYDIFPARETTPSLGMSLSTHYESDTIETQIDEKPFRTTWTQTDDNFTKLSPDILLSLEEKIKNLEEKIKIL